MSVCAVAVGVSGKCKTANEVGAGSQLISGGYVRMDEDKEKSHAAQDVLSLGWLLANMLTIQDLSTVSYCPLPSTKRCFVFGVALFALAFGSFCLVTLV